MTTRGWHKLFAKLIESIRDWKKKYATVSYLDRFDFPTVYSDPIRNKVVKLLRNDRTTW